MNLTEKLSRAIDEQRAELDRLRSHDPAAIAATQRRIIELEAAFARLKVIQVALAGYAAAQRQLSEALRKSRVKQKAVAHRCAHSIAGGAPIGRYLDQLRGLEVSPGLEALLRAELKAVGLDAPQAELRLIEEVSAVSESTTATCPPAANPGSARADVRAQRLGTL